MQWRIWRAFSRPKAKQLRTESGLERSKREIAGEGVGIGQGVVIALAGIEIAPGGQPAQAGVDPAPAEMDLGQWPGPPVPPPAIAANGTDAPPARGSGPSSTGPGRCARASPLRSRLRRSCLVRPAPGIAQQCPPSREVSVELPRSTPGPQERSRVPLHGAVRRRVRREWLDVARRHPGLPASGSVSHHPRGPCRPRPGWSSPRGCPGATPRGRTRRARSGSRGVEHEGAQVHVARLGAALDEAGRGARARAPAGR